MMAAHRLRGIGWMAVLVGIVLGFYLVSLRVAAERKKLDEVNGRIAAAERWPRRPPRSSCATTRSWPR